MSVLFTYCQIAYGDGRPETGDGRPETRDRYHQRCAGFGVTILSSRNDNKIINTNKTDTPVKIFPYTFPPDIDASSKPRAKIARAATYIFLRP
jgi:hypothetical protein